MRHIVCWGVRYRKYHFSMKFVLCFTCIDTSLITLKNWGNAVDYLISLVKLMV